MADALGIARALFAPEVVGFGSRAARVQGLEALARERWQQVWPRIVDFRFDPATLRVHGNPASGALALLVTWSSTGCHPDGRPFARPGRATLLLARGADGWRCVHSHFSLVPGTPDPRA